MPQGLSAHRPTAYPARPGTRPTQRRLAACLSTRKGASKRMPGPARPFSASPVRRRPKGSSTATSWRQQNQGRRATSATTNAPAAVPAWQGVSSANRPTPWGPAFIAVTAAGPGPRGKDARMGVLPSGGGLRCLACLLRVAVRRSYSVLLVCGAALRRIGSCGEARPGVCGAPQRSVSIGAGAARRIR